MNNDDKRNGEKPTNIFKNNKMTIIALTLLIVGLLLIIPSYITYCTSTSDKERWERQKEVWYDIWLEEGDDEFDEDVYYSEYQYYASRASDAEAKAQEAFQWLLVGIALFITGLFLFISRNRNEIHRRARQFLRDERTPRTFMFFIAVFSILCSIFLISMLYSQYPYSGFLRYERYASSDILDDVNITSEDAKLLTPDSELNHPEIFIPQIIVLMVLGIALLLILKKGTKSGTNSENINGLARIVSICIALFIVLFFFGMMYANDFLGRYSLLDPLFGIFAAGFAVTSLIYIFYRIKSMDDKSNVDDENHRPPRKLMDHNAINYGGFTVLFIILGVVVFLIMVNIGEAAPISEISVYWENGESPYGSALPGMNVTYNLTIESRGGVATTRFALVELGVKGNWSINTKEIILRPDEKKNFSFTNYVPENASDGDTYGYAFYFIELDEIGPCLRTKYGCSTSVTNSTVEYWARQSGRKHFIWANLHTGGYNESINMKLLDMLIIIFFAWIVLSFFFIGNYIRKVLIEDRKQVESQ